MAYTLADFAVQHDNLFAQGVVKLLVEESPIMQWLTFKAINGDAYKWREEAGLPGVQYRSANENYLESTGTIGAKMADLKLLGGDMFVDNYFLRTQGQGASAYDIERVQMEMKARAMNREISRAFLEGDNLADPDEPAGMRQVLPAAQQLVAGTNGAALATSMLDQLIDMVVPGNLHFFMPPAARRALTAAMLAGGSAATYQITYGDVDSMGEQTVRYGGIPIHVIRDTGTGTGILGYDETCGSSNVTASIYLVNFDDDKVFGIFNGDGPPIEVRRLGEDFGSPGHKYRVEFFWNWVFKHPRGAARLRGVL